MPQSLKTKQGRVLSKAKRSERFWYLDGSIVLLVEKTLYKLHRSRLSTVSLYFARLFGGPLPDPEIVEVTKGDSEGPIDGEVIDSCPVYRVTCISAGDFDCLLSTLNEGITFAFKKPSFLELASLLRASYTLECPPYLEYATRVLREMWPDQLSQLDPEPSEEQRNFAKETLQLSRECGIPEVRKRAYYELLRTPGFGQVFVSDSDSDEFIDDEDLLQDSQSPLRYVDIVRLVRTREQLQRAWIEIARASPAPSVVPCALEKIPDEKLNPAQGPARNGCRAARDKSAGWWTEQVVCAPLFEQGLLDPLTALQDLVDVAWDELGFCGHCVGERRQLWEDQGEKLWGRLDRWLGLAAPEEDKKKKGRVK
ncbi:hypothetical protein DAEQUDRAFT_680554 [Daedalea quercina L-15889]|uniref:BTB domain-containing protein n=1 Tax=Daedalea quercina L-15889 TaxID=1314783 RepID=A0A165KN08_9APHY|nr:hypothetical protein DAEQUDRAFT_680554 [Daedalea quercina L-15889]